VRVLCVGGRCERAGLIKGELGWSGDVVWGEAARGVTCYPPDNPLINH